jgi:hypothetical protein
MKRDERTGHRFVREPHDMKLVAARYRDAVAALPHLSSTPSDSVDAAVLPAGTSR